MYIYFSLFLVFLLPFFPGADVRQEGRLKDVRDGQVYRVVKLPDGQWWMAEDLRFANCRELTAADFAAASRRNTRGLIRTRDKQPWLGACMWRAEGRGGRCFYNWQAAIQAAQAVYDSGYVNPAWEQEWQGICPEGWHLPSADEYRRLDTLMGPELHRWLGIPTDFVYSNGQSNFGGWGGFWTSSVSDRRQAYSLHFNSSRVDTEHVMDRDWGKPVRCAKSPSAS